MPQGRYSLSFVDYEGSVGTTSVWSPLLNAGNIAAQTAAAQALRDAIAPLTRLNLQKESLLALETKYAVANPTDENAQRGIKWLVRMVEATTGNSVTFNIPGAFLTGFLAAGSRNMDLTLAEPIALVNAIEAFVRSNDGNSVTVSEIVYLD
jgi:hypothetical protein